MEIEELLFEPYQIIKLFNYRNKSILSKHGYICLYAK